MSNLELSSTTITQTCFVSSQSDQCPKVSTETVMSGQPQANQGAAGSRTGSNGVVNGTMSTPSQPQPRGPEAGLGTGGGTNPPTAALSQQNLNQIVSSGPITVFAQVCLTCCPVLVDRLSLYLLPFV